MFKPVIIYFIIVFLIFSFLAALNRSRKYDDQKHAEGMYALTLVVGSGNYILPLIIFTDPQWSVYVCDAYKENAIRRAAYSLWRLNAKLTCSRWYPGEI